MIDIGDVMKNSSRRGTYTILIVILVAITMIITCATLYQSPKRIVMNYFYTRYSETNYTNIKEQSEKQKIFLTKEFLNSGTKFVRFEEDINSLTENEFRIKNPDFKIYKSIKNKSIYNILIKINFDVTSEKLTNWEQRTYYNLWVKVKRVDGRNLIDNIIIVENDFSYNYAQENNHNHDHDYD